MRILGIDIGSRSVKMVLFEDEKILKSEIISTMKFYRDHCMTIDGKVEIDLASVGFHQPDKIISTGYGRNNIQVADALVINELKAHVYGSIYQTGLKDFTLLDIGGQDFKVIKVENGIMVDMILNDKCAASSGRYLENMATLIEISLEELKKHYKNPVHLNTTCAVFGESELIGQIAIGHGISELAAGINYSLYQRIKPQMKKLRSKTLVLTGGVAQNDAMIHYLKEDFGEVLLPQYPQLNGAIGCGYLGMIKERKERHV
ncbi:activator of (R)-2-hydroxyglutaryl-CoA dehydratase HgdC [Clostridium aceticum]|uniref:Activator of (R)-2-hydroxyglutaryl-CoA dehydratase HgdC n=1 Tax=Clostridium aceticum TaxID=84022 RepID=A0A0D8I9M0_9CLOT|nr:acyl-CoA dehydratase activase [Clostridium aceticum]AKL96369.1 activator of (R)-2-hydroxyglutaryl-CoA dehydratase HgdC [Clostridium aceticum]KJF26953.1 2-hydroxyglutaryl-CoA dehydratase [Clostridium aceticum]